MAPQISTAPPSSISERARIHKGDPRETGENRMAHEDIVKKLIDRVPAFQHLTFRQAHRLLEAGEVKSYAKGEQLCAEGEDRAEIYVLLSGELSIKSGGVELSRITTSDIVGEMSLFTGRAQPPLMPKSTPSPGGHER
ncbi:MAG TPA: cyclic nucleotide-binding domain-containing protein [Candidatus Handelsmanbacteria bacterium]|nr:cyclic nucleotide-binding domain-containing protein [Candidatus Handelsmanbacteria bacterium]